MTRRDTTGFRLRRSIRSLRSLRAVAALALAVLAAAGAPAAEKSIEWKQCLRQKPEWYGSAEAVRIADNLLFYQCGKGGWDKNMDWAAPLTGQVRADFLKYKAGLKEDHSTIDNGSTYPQLQYLARVYSATKIERFRKSFETGLDTVLAAQYPNGGWPQFFFRKGYYSHITFNDNAMTGLLRVLREVAAGKGEFAFVDAERRARAAAAVAKGIDCILKCQVKVDGKLTAWCAQHDEQTLAPAQARSYELVSLSGAEGVGIVRFLMEIENPSPEVKAAIEASVAWFEAVKITGIRETRKEDKTLPKGWDKVIVADPAAPPLWARFYEIGTNKPIFCGRDGVKKATLAEIEHERRIGYGWYTDGPAELLEKDYPRWKERVGN